MLTLLLALACSEPAPTPGAPPPPADGQPPGPPPGDATQAPPPGDGASAPPPPGPDGGIPGGDVPGSPSGPPPGLTALVGSGASAKLTVKITGASTATLDFVVEDENGGPKVIAQEKLTGESTTLTVPAAYEKPVWLAAFSDQGAPGPDPSDAIGIHGEAVTFSGTDTEVSITLKSGEPPPLVGPFGKAPEAGTLPGPNRVQNAPVEGGAPPPDGNPPPGGAPPAPAPQ